MVLNDDLHSARDVTKSNTTDVQTFISPGPGLLGTASYGRIRFFRRPSHRHTTDSEFSIDGLERLPRVDILYAHAGMPHDLVQASVSLGARGIVMAGMGNGNVPSETAHALADALDGGRRTIRTVHEDQRAAADEHSRHSQEPAAGRSRQCPRAAANAEATWRY